MTNIVGLGKRTGQNARDFKKIYGILLATTWANCKHVFAKKMEFDIWIMDCRVKKTLNKAEVVHMSFGKVTRNWQKSRPERSY